jgi:hypothetical protein
MMINQVGPGSRKGAERKVAVTGLNCTLDDYKCTSSYKHRLADVVILKYIRSLL